MKLVSYSLRVAPELVRPGALATFGEAPQQVTLVLDCLRVLEQRHGAVARLRADMNELLATGDTMLDDLRSAVEWASEQGIASLQATDPPLAYDWSLLKLQTPVPHPPSTRVFRPSRRAQRAAGPAGRAGEPFCTYGNPTSLVGPDAIIEPPETSQLDLELALGVVIGCGGRNIAAAEAGGRIAGLMIANDWVARDVEAHELEAGVGPGQSRDFATSAGPWIVTLDEWGGALEAIGEVTIAASVNARSVGSVRLAELPWSIAAIVSAASQTTSLRPGELLLMASSVSLAGASGGEAARWLEAGDCVELTADRLGMLRNWVGFRPGR